MIRGTTHDQDARFCDKTKKMIEKSQWPDKYDIKIDLTKVDLELMKAWIEKRLIVLLGQEDDVISGTIVSIIDQNAKIFHVAISGLMLDKTLTFVSQLWDLLDEAQRSARGIPESLLQEKKKSEDLHRKKIDELNAKRYKINSNKFNNVVKRFTNNRDEPAIRERQQRSERQHKKKKHRDRSRSRSVEKKKKHRHSQEKRRHRSRSNERQRQRGNRERQNEVRHRRNKRSPSNEKQQKQRRKPQKDKKRQDTPSNKSDSSDVVSSSDSNDN